LKGGVGPRIATCGREETPRSDQREKALTIVWIIIVIILILLAIGLVRRVL
jgi:flagellar basal body-associated protein FliL